MKPKLFQSLLVLAVIFSLFVPIVANAALPTQPSSGTPNPSSVSGSAGDAPGVDFTIQQIRNIIVGLACWTTQISFFIIIFFILFYGFLFFKSQGNPAKVDEAKKALGWGIIGIIVILGAYTIIATVTNALGGQANPIPIDCSSVGQK
ncbi:MAG: hypothetical protein AAB561_00020 [Patescibacteria group bacterium]